MRRGNLCGGDDVVLGSVKGSGGDVDILSVLSSDWSLIRVG